ncbi:MAG: MATE family efflux transporter, partial [Gammaproteobacteria bacterium]|nr:MATE family efflux transporter [Gammaproteobacteria bacterium]
MSSVITMGMSFTDVIMIGWLGTTELAASAATSDFHSFLFYIVAGIVTTTSIFIAHARGRNELDSVRSIVQQGFLVAAICSIPASFIIYNATFFLSLIGVEQSIVDAAIPYAHTLCMAFLPMTLMTVLQFFIAAHNKTRIILLVTLAGLPLNAFGNYLLLFGNFGFPELKLAGAGIATTITATFMFLCFLVYSLTNSKLKKYYLLHKIELNNFSQLKQIFRVGLPIGISNIGEMGVFLMSTITMGIFGAEALAAHTIALRLGGLFYAFPLGLSQAATIRCGYLIGQKNYERLKLSIITIIKTALIIGIIFMFTIWFYNYEIASLFLSVNED